MFKVADLSPKNMFGNKAATDGTYMDLNIGETMVWLWFGAKSTPLIFGYHFVGTDLSDNNGGWNTDLTWLTWLTYPPEDWHDWLEKQPFEDVSPIKNGSFPLSY